MRDAVVWDSREAATVDTGIHARSAGAALLRCTVGVADWAVAG
jgi:hypothetical protein